MQRVLVHRPATKASASTLILSLVLALAPVGLAALLAAGPASAQQTPTQIGTYGPARRQAQGYRSPSAVHGLPKAEAHLPYLTTRCAEIAEGIRTSPARGVPMNVVAELRREYNDKCALEDQEARHRVAQDQEAARQAKIDQRSAADQRQMATAASAERCGAMRDTIGLRRKREAAGALNEHEVASLRQFEQTFNTQCIAR